MSGTGRLVRVCLVVSLFVLAAAPLRADERILSFHSDLTLNEDASMTVRETIRVNSEGVRIKRGIYRDFPTRYRSPLGAQYRVGFDVLSVKRDGDTEAWHTEAQSNGVRVYFGRKDAKIAPGEHEYVFTYRTTRQIGFFEDHDEIYWNVTGNGWEFPIDHASAAVRLPDFIFARVTSFEAYTGPEGATGRDYAARKAADAVEFETTAPLSAQEGLTIVVSWPRGMVLRPTREQEIGYFLADNPELVPALIGFLVLAGYYCIAWLLVGRDPSRGTIIPRYQPPRDFSPAAMRYLVEMGYDDRVFAAALIDAAVKGKVRIDNSDGTYVLGSLTDNRSDLPAEERQLLTELFRGGFTSVELKQANHRTIRGAREAFENSLRNKLERVYFFTNRRWLIPGIILAAAGPIVAALFGAVESAFATLFICVWLTGWSFGVWHLVSQAYAAWKTLIVSPGVGHAIIAIFITAFSIPFVGGELFGLFMLGQASSPAVPVVLIANVLLTLLFHHLLKAPTKSGRTLLDEVEGFRLYLSVAEGQELAALQPSDRTPEVYERYLPYALALGVEQEWSEKFAGVLNKAGEPPYSPAWYHGSSFDPGRPVSSFASSLGGSLSSSISASSTAPGKSSGSSGGGSSGGGGGGGGGGGW